MTISVNGKTPKVQDGKLLLKLQPSGIKTDGILIFKMMKPGDEGEGGFNIGQVSVQVEAVTNLLGALTRARIKVNVEEDPRIKAWCIGSRYKGIFAGFIKHAPLVIPVYNWLMNRNSIGYGKSYDNETDSLGPTHKTWEPKVLDFSVSGKNEVGMVKGKEYFDNISWRYYPIERTVWDQGGYDDDPEWRTFYDIDDFVYQPKMFGDSPPSPTTGSSLLDKVNAARFSNSLLPISGHSGMMTVAQNHADYMLSINALVNFHANSHEDEISQTSIYFEFEEYGRLVYNYREYLSSGINMDEVYNKAMTDWLANPATSEILLRNGYNAAGFGESEIKLNVSGLKADYSIFISLDMAVLSSEGKTPEDIFNAQVGAEFEVDYTQDMDTPKFAINSFNPMCKEFWIYDDKPIPSDVYFLFGFYNDKSVLSDAQREYDGGDPVNSPILLATIEATYRNLKAGIVIEASENALGHARYKVKMPSGEVEEDVKGGSISRYPVGRWVVIQGPDPGGWRIVPSSSKYWKNVQNHGAGIS